jgi:hypothetical protein
MVSQAMTVGRRPLQLITPVVDVPRGRKTSDPLWPALGAVRGVETVEPDPVSARVWVFAAAGVVPEALVEALAAWKYGAYVLESRVDSAA